MEPLTTINQIPACPIISRFVAPWDTSGWYSVFPDFSVGKRLYSNSDVTVTALPDKYCGWEYIMTFDSKTDGFDDKQEVDFYLEQDATIFVALEYSAPYDFLPAFKDTEDTMQASDGTIYRILASTGTEGAQIHIPGFTGDFHHFVVFVTPQSAPTAGEAFETLSTKCTLSPYEKRNYTWYFHEVFNPLTSEMLLDKFTCHGACNLVRYPHSMQRKYVSLKDGASIEKQITGSGQEILECSIQVFNGFLHVNFCEAELILGNNEAAQKNGQALAFNNENNFHLRFIRKAPAAGSNGSCDVWVNNRFAGQMDCSSDSTVTMAICAGDASFGALDYISLKDNTEIFVAEEDFSVMPSNITLSPTANAVISEYPFSTNKSLCLTDGSLCYAFSPVTDVVTIDTKVKAENNDFVILPELRDSEGQLALRIAMYHNNLYASNGQTWKRIFVGDTDWMYYPCSNWYNIRITAHLSDNTYSVYVDGAKRVVKFPFTNPVKNISQIGYYVKTGKLYINELHVYDSQTICRSLMPPTTIFDIRQAPYNACGDGKTLETEILQRAIDDAAYTGGVVYLHDGCYLTGSLKLHSDITFFIDPSATLIGSNDHALYPLYTPGNSLCASRQLGRGILYGQNLCNLRVCGGGTLDGQGLYRFKMNDPAYNRLPDSRPCMIYVAYSSNITLDDVHFRSSAYWTVVPLSCQNVLMQYLDLDCMNTPNRDGIDPVDCCDMTIRRCCIMAGDDGLCFKSSDDFGCENIDVEDMMIQSLASGIKFGTDTYYSLKNVHIKNCAIKNVNRCGVSLESVDGAAVSNVTFEEIDMTNVGAPVYITIGVRGRLPRNINIKRKSSISDVTFKHIRFDQAYPFSFTKDIHETMIIGQDKSQSIKNILFSDCYLELPGGFLKIPEPPKPIDKKYPEYDQHGLSTGHAFCTRYAENIQFENCKVILEQPDVRPMIGETVE